ncbi:hypothetical protein CRM22_010900, partial [Opisthorchis felineus]
MCPDFGTVTTTQPVSQCNRTHGSTQAAYLCPDTEVDNKEKQPRETEENTRTQTLSDNLKQVHEEAANYRTQVRFRRGGGDDERNPAFHTGDDDNSQTVDNKPQQTKVAVDANSSAQMTMDTTHIMNLDTVVNEAEVSVVTSPAGHTEDAAMRTTDCEILSLVEPSSQRNDASLSSSGPLIPDRMCPDFGTVTTTQPVSQCNRTHGSTQAAYLCPDTEVDNKEKQPRETEENTRTQTLSDNLKQVHEEAANYRTQVRFRRGGGDDERNPAFHTGDDDNSQTVDNKPQQTKVAVDANSSAQMTMDTTHIMNLDTVVNEAEVSVVTSPAGHTEDAVHQTDPVSIASPNSTLVKTKTSV